MADDRGIGPVPGSPGVPPVSEEAAVMAVALAFCRDCLGWEDARCIDNDGDLSILGSVSRKPTGAKLPPHRRSFHFMQLDQVMAAVVAWLDDETDRLAAPARTRAACRLGRVTAVYRAGRLDQAEFSRALLSACVAAVRVPEGAGDA